MRESWWIDVLEGELNQEKFQGVELIHKHSETDQLIINNLKQVKSIIKEQMDEELPEDEAYYKTLHRNIMNDVREFEASKKIETKKKQREQQTQLAKIKVAKFYFSMGM